MKYFLLTLTILVLGAVAVELRRALVQYFKLRRKQVVSCPETRRTATIRIAAGKAAAKAIIDDPQLWSLLKNRVKQCSQWPAERCCGRGCLAQIEKAPKARQVSRPAWSGFQSES